jgi:hypothetical protein
MAARSAFAAALADDDFMLDCVTRELSLIRGLKQGGHRREGLLPFFVLPELGIRFAFGYWAPGGTPGPHEHSAWTITAVCRNVLDVVTFDRAESYRQGQLVIKRQFRAPAGRSGCIYEPAIHQPINTSDQWSVTMHVTSPRDGETLVDGERPLDMLTTRHAGGDGIDGHAYAWVIAARQRHTAVHQLMRMLADMRHPRAAELLDDCAGLASSRARKFAARNGDGLHRSELGMLRRVHPELVLQHDRHGDAVTLYVDTPGGMQPVLTLSDLAGEAIAVAAAAPCFDAQALPGSLTDQERADIADALEHAGLFERSTP